MSSSRIIKHQAESSSTELPSFSFKPIHQAATADSSTGSGFVPLGLFDTSELTGAVAAALHVAPEPDGTFITDDDLNSRLRDSFQNGLAEGKNLAERGLINVFKALRTASEDLHSLREKTLRESEDELLKLILLVARKVILREVSQDRSILSDVVRNALSGLSERDEITVRLNPDDFALATAGREDSLRRELITDRMQLKPDPTVPAGCCQVDTEMGTIDASIDSQLDEIYRRMLDERCIASGNG